MNSDLFAGIAAALKGGTESYLATNKDNETRALAKRKNAADLASKGLMEDENGKIVMTPEQQSKKSRELEKFGLEKHKTEAEIAKLEHDAKKPFKESNPLADEMRLARLDEMGRKKEEAAYKKSPKGRLEGAGGDVKQKLGFLTGGLKSLTDYEGSFRKGERQGYLTPQTPLVGGLISSTPVDDARTQMEESIGRLASGGAINKGEEARFRSMIPKAGDNDEAAARKLTLLRKEMENKLQAYGFATGDLEQLGFDPKARGYGDEFADQPGRGLLKPKGGAGLLDNSAAGQKPDFGSMTEEQLKAFLGGK